MILALNFAVNPQGLSLLDEEGVGVDLYANSKFRFAEQVDDLLAQAQDLHPFSLSDIQACITLDGPGSYTGLRIAHTFCKTFAQVQEIPFYSVPTFIALLTPFVGSDGVYLVFIPGRKSDVNGQLFSINKGQIHALSDPFVWLKEDVQTKLARFETPLTLVGELPTGLDLSKVPSLQSHQWLLGHFKVSDLIQAYRNGLLNDFQKDPLKGGPIYSHDAVS